MKKSIRFTNAQIERYSRQIILPEVGGKGQKKLLSARALLIGCGGLGSSCAYYLAAAGVGTLGLADSDKVELSNLNRQTLHFTDDVSKSKVVSASEKLKKLNPDIKVIPHHTRLTSANILEIVKGYDVVIDSSDNFPTKYLTNDACVMSSKPLVHAGVLKFDGQAMTILPKKGPCYRCVFPEPPPSGIIPSCQKVGILGTVAGILGLIQASEVIKYILGVGELLVGKLLVVEILTMEFRKLTIRRNSKGCPVCGDNPTVTELTDYERRCTLKQ